MSKHASLEFADLKNIYDQSVPGHFSTDDYTFFWAGPFSNWHPSEFTMGFPESMDKILPKRRVTFNCAEQAMMYSKALIFKDYDSMEKILAAKEPGKQKALGRAVANYDEARWVNCREWIVTSILCAKFRKNPELLEVLLNTGNRHIVEASPYDKVWGIAMGVDKYPAILDKNNWKGQNLLGECLMDARRRLKANADRDTEE